MARQRRKTGGILLLILLFIIAVTVTLTLPILNISSVTVTGNDQVTTEEIMATGTLPIGTNIYRVSMKKAKEKIEALPYILTAEVKRKFPARVSVTVVERKEAAAVVCPGGYAVIDNTGRVLRLTPEEEDICIVSGSGVANAAPGQAIVMEDERFLENLVLLFAEVEKTDLKVQLRAIRIASALEVVLETKTGLEIHLGGMDELSYKFQLCRNILNGGHAGINKDSSGVLKWTGDGQFSYRQNKN